MDNKTKKRIIIIIIAFIIIISFNIYIKSPSVRIKRYLINREFILEEDDTFYYKKLSNKSIEEYEEDKNNNISSSYDYLYFDIYNKVLSEEINDYIDQYETSININYSFPKEQINYYYRIDYNNNKSIILKGTYDETTKKFECKKEFAHNININDYKKMFCDYAKIYIESNIYIKNKLFNGPGIKKYLK
ncbi:MAG: hypothetical protein IKF19_06035 [Bacilli bacterium]|nr:hypothetical protein [Bacilli bacterium]